MRQLQRRHAKEVAIGQQATLSTFLDSKTSTTLSREELKKKRLQQYLKTWKSKNPDYPTKYYHIRKHRMQQKAGLKLCECGHCNNLIPALKTNGKVRHFAIGHSKRILSSGERKKRRSAKALRWFREHKDDPGIKERKKRNEKKRRERNGDAINAYQRQWHRDHPGKYREYELRRKDWTTKICSQCGEKFSHLTHLRQRRFCSIECVGLANSLKKSALSITHITKIYSCKIGYVKCLICERIVVRRAHIARQSKFCSKECGWEFIRHRLRPSLFQKDVFEKIKEIYPNSSMEYRIKKWFVDIFIPDKNICIECDGFFWHKGREKQDIQRQLEIENAGYRMVRIPELDWRRHKNIFRYI